MEKGCVLKKKSKKINAVELEDDVMGTWSGFSNVQAQIRQFSVSFSQNGTMCQKSLWPLRMVIVVNTSKTWFYKSLPLYRGIG